MHIAPQNQLFITAFALLVGGGCAGDDPDRRLDPFDEGTGGADLVDMAQGTDTSDDVASDGASDMPADDVGMSLCDFNSDGAIARTEFPIEVGLGAHFMVGSEATFDSRGDGAMPTTWDLTGDFANDRRILSELGESNGWWSGDYPNATYVARLSEANDLLGVFQATNDALLLLGVVSAEDDIFVTNLEYDPPVEVLKFPIARDDTWQTDAQVTGTTEGVISFFSERYTNRVDRAGTLRTPFADFDVLRVNVQLERTVGLLTTHVRTHLYVTECFGTVGTVRSVDGVTDPEFTDVAELRRLAP